MTHDKMAREHASSSAKHPMVRPARAPHAPRAPAIDGARVVQLLRDGTDAATPSGFARAGYQDLVDAARLGPGRPLDAPVRARMESAFDHDFAHVRIHDDANAAAMSHDLHARAFAVGDHVAFAAGRYQPGAPAGDHLIAHELAHVIQQRDGRAAVAASPADGVPINADPALEADADHAADGAMRALHGAASPATARGPHLRAGVAIARDHDERPPANYDDVKHTITVTIPRGLTADTMKQNLAQQKSGGTITSWKADGVRTDSDEEVAILFAIWQLNHVKFWDREVDLVTEIGGGKRGAITVRIDAHGNAVGSIVLAGVPAVAAKYTDTATAIADLKTRFKLSDIAGENGKSWSVGELNKVAAAWALLSRDEAAALEGYRLIRTDDTLHTDDGGLAAGVTTTGNTVADDNLSSTRVREIRFADRAFGSDGVAFVGDTANAAPTSVQTILHEVGHAQERKLQVDTKSAQIEAQIKLNVAGKASDRSAQAALDAINAGISVWRKLKNKPKLASKPYVDALFAAFRAIDVMRVETDPVRAATLQQAAHAAVDAKDRLRAKLPSASPAIAAFAAAETALTADLAAAEAVLTAAQAVAPAKATMDAAVDSTGTRSTRLQRFVDFVNAKGIKPFTKYGRDNWPRLPGEFYAEAFSFWRADPKFLASASPELKRWFDTGEHLKP